MSEVYELGVELAEQEELSGTLSMISQMLTSIDAAVAASDAGILALMGKNDTMNVGETPPVNTVGAAPEMQSLRGASISPVETLAPDMFSSGDVETTASPSALHSENSFKGGTKPTVAAAPSGEPPRVRPVGSVAPSSDSVEPLSPEIVVAPVATGYRELAVFMREAASPESWNEWPGMASRSVKAGLARNGVTPSGEDRGVEIISPDLALAGSAASQVEAAAPRREVSLTRSEVVRAEWPRFAAAPEADGMFGGLDDTPSPFGEPARPLRGRAEAPAGERGGRKSFEAATAPQMRREQGSGVPSGMFSEQAAAPTGDAGARQDDGRAVVMLDGRLVGEMLSSRMARDAARPGAGTTFFDPRQAPAWTPSGSL